MAKRRSSFSSELRGYESVECAHVTQLITGYPSIFFFRSFFQSTRGVHVLLLGLADSGKTRIFAKLVSKNDVVTQTSMQTNEGDVVIAEKGSSLRLVDIPGHNRIRSKFLEQYKKTAKALVFVVDSASIQKDIRDIAEFLFDVLTDPVLYDRSLPVLVACNKSDLALAKKASVVKEKLEKEIELLQKSRGHSLDKAERRELRCKSDSFQFDQLAKLRVEFVECSSPDNLAALQEWLQQLA